MNLVDQLGIYIFVLTLRVLKYNHLFAIALLKTAAKKTNTLLVLISNFIFSSEEASLGCNVISNIVTSVHYQEFLVELCTPWLLCLQDSVPIRMIGYQEYYYYCKSKVIIFEGTVLLQGSV